MSKLLDVADMIHDEVKRAFAEEGYVQVVRCKDCKHFDEDVQIPGKKRCFCYLHGEFQPMDYFCASAERREK